MVNFREEMRKEVEQYNWNRRKTEEEKERRHALHALLRLLRHTCHLGLWHGLGKSFFRLRKW